MVLLAALVAGPCAGHGGNGMPYDDAAAYTQALEDAMNARYGSRDAWPQGFDTFLAVARYYGGVDATYASTTAWAAPALRDLEEKAVADKTNGEAALEFLNALKDSMTPPDAPDPCGFSWPYEAQALMNAAFVYANNASCSNEALLPSEGDMTQKDAIAIALEAIQQQYDLSDEDIGQYPVYSRFTTTAIFETPFWAVIIGLNDQGYELYYAYIASPSGEILRATRNDANG